MSRSLSWIEPEALADALGRAGLRPGPRGLRRGPAPALEATLAPPAPAPQPATKPAPVPAAPPPPPAESAAEPRATDGRIESRLGAYLDWISFESGGRTVFVLDQDGLFLMQREADPDLLAIASAAMNLLARLRSALEDFHGNAIAIEVDGGRTLHLVQVATRMGDLATGFVTAGPVSPALLQGARRGLTEALGVGPAPAAAGGEEGQG